MAIFLKGTQNGQFRPKCKRGTLCKNLKIGHFPGPTLKGCKIIYSCSVQKTPQKNTKYSRNQTTFKIGHHAKPIAHAKASLWVKNSHSKKPLKIHSTNHLQLFCAKQRSKNTKHSINETIFKNGHHAKAIAHAKSSLWVKNSNSMKQVKIHSTNHPELFSAKNRSKKHQIFDK